RRLFAPWFVLVPGEFACDLGEPLGGLSVTPAGVTTMARACLELAEECSGGRLVAVLEGGYDLEAICDGVDVVLATLRGTRTVLPLVTGDARRIDPVLERVRAAQAPYWRLCGRGPPALGSRSVRRRAARAERPARPARSPDRCAPPADRPERHAAQCAAGAGCAASSRRRRPRNRRARRSRRAPRSEPETVS